MVKNDVPALMWFISERWDYRLWSLDLQISPFCRSGGSTQPIQTPKSEGSGHSFSFLSCTLCLTPLSFSPSRSLPSSRFHSLFIRFCRCFLFLEPKLPLPTCGSFSRMPFYRLCIIISGPKASTTLSHQNTRVSILLSCRRKRSISRTSQNNL